MNTPQCGNAYRESLMTNKCVTGKQKNCLSPDFLELSKLGKTFNPQLPSSPLHREVSDFC
jgi:hypothetical protein